MVEIVLLQDVAKLGKKGAVVRTSAGYAQFLIRQGKARTATESAKKAAQQLAQAAQAKVAQVKERIQKALDALKKKLTIKTKANEQGHLFEGIDASKLAELVKKETGQELSADIFVLEAPIKEVGTHKVTLVFDDVNEVLEVVIEPEA